MSSPRMLADEELAVKALQGDKEAFAELYELYFDSVYDHILRMVRDSAEAADVAQETFMKLLANRDMQPPRTSFRAWIFTIARNTAIDRIRRNRRQTRMRDTRDDEDQQQFCQLPSSEGETPEQAAAQAELASLVWDAAKSLRPNEHSLLDLHLRQHLEPDEIAEVMNTNRTNVYKMLSRLREHLEEAVTALLLARRSRQECEELNRIMIAQSQNVDLDARARRAINRHAQDCETCGDNRRRFTTAAELFGSFVPVLASAEVKAEILSDLMGSLPQDSDVASEGSGGPSGVDAVASTRSLTLHPWSSLGLLPKIAILSVMGLVAAGGIMVAALLSIGAANLEVTNANCSSISFGDTALIEMLPILELPDQPIDTGNSGIITLPAGNYSLAPTASGLEAKGYSATFQIPLPSELESLDFNGSNLLEEGGAISLEKGTTQSMTITCR